MIAIQPATSYEGVGPVLCDLDYVFCPMMSLRSAARAQRSEELPPVVAWIYISKISRDMNAIANVETARI